MAVQPQQKLPRQLHQRHTPLPPTTPLPPQHKQTNPLRSPRHLPLTPALLSSLHWQLPPRKALLLSRPVREGGRIRLGVGGGRGEWGGGEVGNKEEAGKDPELVHEEEVTEGDWQTPQVEVSLVSVDTGEEEENIFWHHRAKLFRWDSGESAWKERGIGEAKLLTHRNTGKIRFLLRQEKTHKVVANHYVRQTKVYCNLKPNVSSDKIWVWTVPDSAEGAPQVEQFGLKFGQIEQAQIFKTKFDEAAKLNCEIFGDPTVDSEQTDDK
eukprot:GHVQ01008878.1.p1 GENE.GHVQ01008878.1~~GHVQ01008878.1.p1  ORF type:complete len:267 (+),score=63.54 GHVQ01008878.1:77-877(+)